MKRVRRLEECLEVLEEFNGIDRNSLDVVSISCEGRIGIMEGSKRTEKLDSNVFESV